MQPLQARDLRIGNYVTFLGKERQLLGLSKRNYEMDTETTHYYAEFKDHIPVMFTHLRPIPLSEQWLLDFGFELNHCDDGTAYYTLKLSNKKYCDLSLISCDKNGYLEVGLFPYESIFRFRYLHQLQNICLDLGQELTTNTK